MFEKIDQTIIKIIKITILEGRIEEILCRKIVLAMTQVKNF